MRLGPCLLSAAFLLCTCSSFAYADSTSTTPESDAEKFVRITRSLEKDPLQDTTKELRGWLVSWASKSPDVTVTMCDILGPIPKQDVPYGAELLMQAMFGNAAFQIEHPDKKADELLDQVAGIESLLKAYSAILLGHPKAHIPYFDDLLKKKEDGTLEKFVSPLVAKKCSKATGA